jgi:hypothetical protein
VIGSTTHSLSGAKRDPCKSDLSDAANQNYFALGQIGAPDSLLGEDCAAGDVLLVIE